MEQPFDYFVDNIPCVRYGKRGYVEMCDECVDELDAYAIEALKAVATEKEIEEWCWQHDIKRGESK